MTQTAIEMNYPLVNRQLHYIFQGTWIPHYFAFSLLFNKHYRMDGYIRLRWGQEVDGSVECLLSVGKVVGVCEPYDSRWQSLGYICVEKTTVIVTVNNQLQGNL